MKKDRTAEHVEALVDEAVQMLQADLLLFKNRAHERSITHRLAVYLERLFGGWDVDCEYNRIEDDPNSYKGGCSGQPLDARPPLAAKPTIDDTPSFRLSVRVTMVFAFALATSSWNGEGCTSRTASARLHSPSSKR